MGSPAPMGPTPEPAGDHAARILYIEDNPSNLVLVRRLLTQRARYQMLEAYSGLAGLEVVRQDHPDVILLDLHLPDISGVEVLRHLREDLATRQIPVVIISADATPSVIAHLLAAGARAYLTKPLDMKHLLDLLQELAAGLRGPAPAVVEVG